MERGPDRVRLDLGSRHQLLAADGGRVDVAERRRGAAHHDDLAAQLRVGHLAVQDVRERDGGDRAGRAAVVDPGAAVAEAVRIGRVVGQPLGGRHGDALEAANLAREAGDGAARVVAKVGRGGARVDRAEVLVAAQHAGVAVAVALAGGEDGAAGVAEGVVEREVLGPARGLGELDVVDDRSGARPVKAAHDLGVLRARERPVVVQVGEGLGVDTDDDEALDPLRAAHVEARLERLALERSESARLAGGHADRAGGERDARQRGEAAAGGHGSWGGQGVHGQNRRRAARRGAGAR